MGQHHRSPPLLVGIKWSNLEDTVLQACCFDLNSIGIEQDSAHQDHLPSRCNKPNVPFD